MYYSNITNQYVDESEALKEIIDLCNRWHDIVKPPQTLETYLMDHPEVFNIDEWNCFKKIG